MARILLWSLALALLTACGSAPPPATGRPGAISDRAPHPEVLRRAAPYPVRGVDVSKFQGPIDWPAAARAGVAFAFIKATEGGDRVDEFLRDNLRGAKQAGIPHGAYHFFYHCRPASEQARWFIAHVPRAPGGLPPVLDIEWTPTSPTCTIRRPASVIRAEMADFLRIVGAHYGTRPVIYATLDFYQDNDLNLLGPQDFWLRSVAAHPRDAYPGQDWTFWQFTSTGIVPGISTDADINAFAGSAAAWAAWRGARSQ